MTPLIEIAPAKVNMFLHVTGRRKDGYHNLESMVCFSSSIADKLTYYPNGQPFRLGMKGPFARQMPAGVHNSIIQALGLFQKATGQQVTGHLLLEKNLPIAAGIGGGSSDAAAALRLIARHHKIDDASAVLHKIAPIIGADVPVCLPVSAAYMRGTGEDIIKIPNWPPCPVVLVNPGVQLSTKDVFQALDIPFSPPLVRSYMPPQDIHEYIEWLWQFTNTLTDTAKKQCPAIGNVIRAFIQQKGCRLTRMSGSGATCFGLFEHKSTAAAAAKEIKKNHPDWWVAAGMLNE